jgi:Planctomycete cytochrome C/WD domain, G-beta repeat
MNLKLTAGTASGLFVIALVVSGASAADAPAKPKVTFADHVAPIFKSRCNSCHNGDKQKGGLNLETFSAAMQGGGSGKVVEPGDPDSSHLLALVAHTDEPKMPPNSPKMPDAELAVIRSWIEGGALETSGSVAVAKAKPKFEFKLDPTAMGKPVGPPAMPEKLLTEPVVVSPRPDAVVALASSPWAPLVAIGGHKQVIVYNTLTGHLSAVLPFPEGHVYTLKFSRNGALLLAGGGRGGQSGLAVVWDVKTGKRAFEIGKEYDVVLAADISPDHGLVALGGPSKIVRVYNTADGQLQYELKKHTEWITAVEFSPDGVLLATGDRNNGLVVWEAQTSREFFDLRGHTGAITDVSWRPDSNVLASCSEDGTVKLWEMENGNQIKNWGAHGGGTASVRFAKDGRLVTAGRDRVVRLWDQNGAKQRDFEPFGDLALETVFTFDDARVIAGDWSGEVRVFDSKDGRRLANLIANPAPLTNRLETARQALVAAQAAADAASKSLVPLQAAVAANVATQDKSAQAFTVSITSATQLKTAGDAAEKVMQTRAAEQKAATDAAAASAALAAKANADKFAAEKAVPEKIAAEKAASDALAAAKAAVDAALARKAEQDKAVAASVATLKLAVDKAAADKGAAELGQQAMKATESTVGVGLAGSAQAAAQGRWEQAVLDKANAPKLLEQATAVAKTTADAAAAAQAKAVATAAPKAAADKILADARTAQKAAEVDAAAKKVALDQSTAARAAADKALADRKPAVDAAIASVAAMKAEADALAVEKLQLDATKSAMAPTASKGL